MTLLRWFFSPFRRTPSPQKILHILAKDEARAQAQWQLLKKKLRRRIKEQNQIIRLETQYTQLFDELRKNYHLVDSVLRTKDSSEKDRAERLVEQLDNKCEEIHEAILISLPPRRKRTKAKKQEAKWQIAVIEVIRDHLDFLDHLLLEMEEY